MRICRSTSCSPQQARQRSNLSSFLRWGEFRKNLKTSKYIFEIFSHLNELKMLKPLVKNWVPEAFVVSFKLETDINLLKAKSQRALKTYDHEVRNSEWPDEFKKTWLHSLTKNQEASKFWSLWFSRLSSGISWRNERNGLSFITKTTTKNLGKCRLVRF